MSHDRGCGCGREGWVDYQECKDPLCMRNEKAVAKRELEHRRKAMSELWDEDDTVDAEVGRTSSKKKPVVKATDQELLDAINKARQILALAIDDAMAAGLEVELRISTDDTVNPRYGITKVRSIPATAVRRIK